MGGGLPAALAPCAGTSASSARAGVATPSCEGCAAQQPALTDVNGWICIQAAFSCNWRSETDGTEADAVAAVAMVAVAVADAAVAVAAFAIAAFAVTVVAALTATTIGVEMVW
mgnify:CR=1 FL=1